MKIYNYYFSTLLAVLSVCSSLSANQLCDTLLLHSGQKIAVKNIEYRPGEITYQRCGIDSETRYAMKTDRVKLVIEAPILIGDALKTDLVSAADSMIQKDGSRRYEAWVYLVDEFYPVEGYLDSLKATSVVILPKEEGVPPSEIEVKDIYSIKIKEKRVVGRGMKWGALFGFIIGAGMGLTIWAVNDHSIDPDNGWVDIDLRPDLASSVAVGAGLGTVLGIGVGAAASAIRVEIPIRGKQRKYEKAVNKRFRF